MAVVHTEASVLLAVAFLVPGVAVLSGLAGLTVPALKELVAVVAGRAAAVIVVLAFLVHAESKEAELPCGTGEELALRRALQPEPRVQAFEAVAADSARASTTVVSAGLAFAVRLATLGDADAVVTCESLFALATGAAEPVGTALLSFAVG